jgi:flagellar protein FlaG
MAIMINDLSGLHTYKREGAKTETRRQQPDQAEKVAAEQAQQRAQQAQASKELDSTKELAAKLNKLPQSVRRNLEFSLDQATGQQVIRVLDSETKELVRQIPSDQVLHLIKRVQEMQGDVVPGLFLDDST